jgi:hypothetical protein
MSNTTSDTISFAGLWITVVLSIVFLVEQLSANNLLG